jgi:hypothetical protein
MHNKINKTVRFGVTDECNLWSTLLGWPQMAWCTYQVSLSLVLAFRYSKFITSTILKAAILVVLTGRIYDTYPWDDLRRHDIYIPSFMTIDSGIHVILRVLPQQFGICNVSTIEENDLWHIPLRCLHVAWYCNQYCRRCYGIDESTNGHW